MQKPITTSADKVKSQPGYYRGAMTGYELEIIGAHYGSKSETAKCVEGIRGGAFPVIVCVDENHVATAYEDMSSKYPVQTDEPLSADYIRKLIEARRMKIGPAVSRINTELIERAMELNSEGSICVSVASVMEGVSMDLVNVLIDSFRQTGIIITVELNQLDQDSNSDLFEIKIA